MVHLTQIKNTEDILRLRDYYTLSLNTVDSGSDHSELAVSELGMVQISDGEVINQASVVISGSENGVTGEQIARSLARLLLGSTIIAEPSALVFLRTLLDKVGEDGELFFIPLSKLVSALHPDLQESTLSALREYYELDIPDAESEVLQDALLTDAVFRRCVSLLPGAEPDVPASAVKKASAHGRKTTSPRHGEKKRVSDKKLDQWADKIWTISPWAFLGVIATVVILLLFLFPKKEDTTVDRSTAPNSYLVLSWDKTGKYGTQPHGKDTPIEFRIPYGVYNVLNNNSIPVELTIANEDKTATVKELSVSDTDEEDSAKTSTVIIRPSMSREIILDEEQYLMLSEDANELIFFYVSAVPEEIASDTTGQVSDSQSVVYAYVKGTEVRFRSSPSLEGHIIDTLNNGQQVQVLGITGEWTHVSVQDHKGYIFSQFLTTQEQTPDSETD